MGRNKNIIAGLCETISREISRVTISRVGHGLIDQSEWDILLSHHVHANIPLFSAMFLAFSSTLYHRKVESSVDDVQQEE